jgi:maltooligosyltrehalose synthase
VQNQELNSMMKSYLENQEKAKVFHEQRKNELQRKTILENLNTRSENLNELKEKMKNSNNENEINNLNSNIKSIEEKINEDNERKENLEKQLEELNKKIKLYSTQNIKESKLPKIIEKD